MSLIKRKEQLSTGSVAVQQLAGIGLPLHIRLRPRRLEDLLGHEAVVKSLAGLLATSPPHAFLFTGPSGVGKTTLARILATLLRCSLIEIDAARWSGVDNMREVIKSSQFAALGDSARKMIVIDECHRLSRGAWDSLLLSIEEPPPHLFWGLCSTEADKIPNTIRTRCHAFDLKPLRWEVLADYLEQVIKAERLKIVEGVPELVARRAQGSVRQALVFLSAVAGTTDKAEAMRLLESADLEEGNPVQLARMICTSRGFSWDAARKLLVSMSEESPEALRLVIIRYATKMILDAKGDAEARRLLAVIETFSGRSYNSSEGQAPLLLGIGTLLFGG